MTGLTSCTRSRWQATTNSLAAGWIGLGQESDRIKIIEDHDWVEASWRVWNMYEFGDDVPRGPNLKNDPEYLEAERQAFEQLGGLGFAQREVFTQVAKQVSLEHPLRSVTEDFVVYAFSDDWEGVLLENIAFSAPRRAHEILDRKQLV